MSYNTAVYLKQGGGELVVTADGTLTIEAGATVEGLAAVVEQPAIADISGTNLTPIALDTSDTYTDAAVNTAVNAVITALEARLDAMDAKQNALLAALRTANVIAAS